MKDKLGPKSAFARGKKRFFFNIWKTKSLEAKCCLIDPYKLDVSEHFKL